jgi:hypothetical protein
VSKPIKIVVESIGRLVGYMCGECRTLYDTPDNFEPSDAEEWALSRAHECCVPRACDVCSIPLGRRFPASCSDCMFAEARKRKQNALDKATKVAAKDYDGGVFWSDVGPQEGYFVSVDDMLAHCEDEGVDPPAMVWGSRKVPFSLSAETILEHALEDHHEGAGEQITTAEGKRLQAFLDEWAEAQNINSFEEDRDIAVVVGEVK